MAKHNADAYMLALPGLGIEVYWFERLWRAFPPHFHENWLVGCLLAGGRRLFIGNAETALEPGRLAVIPPFVSHACEPLGRFPANWLCMQINAEKMPPRLHEPIPAFFTYAGPLAAQFAGLADMAKTGTCSGHALACFLNALASAKTDAPPLRCPMPGAARSLPCDCDARASQSKFCYLRRFKACAGLTPGRYNRSQRIIKAQRLLKEGCRLADCAIACGFYDQSHFCRIFKANIGMAPGAWRDSCGGAG